MSQKVGTKEANITLFTSLISLNILSLQSKFGLLVDKYHSWYKMIMPLEHMGDIWKSVGVKSESE